jgi:hypothetical protein
MHTHTAPDPHDPLAPRPDDPWIGRWWFRRLYDRDRSEMWLLRWPIVLGAALLVVGLVALAVVVLAGLW